MTWIKAMLKWAKEQDCSTKKEQEKAGPRTGWHSQSKYFSHFTVL